MDIEAIQKSYRRYARNYDFWFGAIFEPGRRAVIERMRCRPGEHILEVGVGTGLSLPLYPRHVRVTGIDLSAAMLARAQARQQRDELTNVELFEMDAEQMRFADNSFNKVVAMYVASVVPHPAQLVAEMRRVCRPGGDLFIVNHFHSRHPLISGFEKVIAPLSRLLGFHPDFCLDTFLRDTDLQVTEQVGVNLFGYWTLLRAANDKSGAIPLVEDELPAPRVAVCR